MRQGAFIAALPASVSAPSGPIQPSAPVTGVIPGVNYPNGAPSAFISGVWFVPQRDSRGNILTPIFAAVEEL